MLFDRRGRLAWAALLALACSPIDRGPELPPGAWVAGDAGSLSRVLARVEHRDDLPIGRAATALRHRIGGCRLVYGHDAGGSIAGALAAADCTGSFDPGVAALRGDAGLALAVPVGAQGRIEGTARVDAAGGVELDARLALPDGSAIAQLLEPAEQPPGPGVLNADDTLLHARLRPAAGLDIARLVPDGSQGADLFRLKSRLFSGVVLDGTWEIAVYMPDGPTELPPMALAVGFRMRDAALAAADEFVGELRRNWPVQQSAHTFSAGQGACLTELRVLPGLAPCYLATGDSLVVGWNPGSLERALARGSVDAPDGAMVVHLERFGEADARLGRGGGETLRRLDYAWERLEARPERRDGAFHLSVRLVVGDAS